jgi:hypothetical protein
MFEKVGQAVQWNRQRPDKLGTGLCFSAGILDETVVNERHKRRTRTQYSLMTVEILRSWRDD